MINWGGTKVEQGKAINRESEKGINVEFFCGDEIDLVGNFPLKSGLFKDGAPTEWPFSRYVLWFQQEKKAKTSKTERKGSIC